MAVGRASAASHRPCPRDAKFGEKWLLNNQSLSAGRLAGDVLLIVAGSLRGADDSWDSLARLLHAQRAALMLVIAEPMAVALELHASNGSATQFHNRLGKHATYIESVPEFADYAQALDLMENEVLADGEAHRSRRVKPWRERPIRCPRVWWEPSRLGGVRNASCHNGTLSFLEPLPARGSAAIVGVYRWYTKRAIIRRGLLGKYDWFVYTRTDSHMLCAPLLPTSVRLGQEMREGAGGVAIVPAGEDWGGLTERFIIASRRAILPALTTLEHWVHGRAPLALNSESQLRRSLVRACVRVLRVPRTTFVVQRITLAPRRNQKRQPRVDVHLPAFELARSNWGRCMHAASHIDVGRFAMPPRWGMRPVRVPVQMQERGMCPKYAAGWWLARAACGVDANATHGAS